MPKHLASPHLTPEMLALPAPQAARIVAVALLDAVRQGHERVLAKEGEGLHDLRVALRRLRSWLRAFRPELDDSVTKKTRRRLTELARDTNAARDAEVALAWIERQAGLPPRTSAGRRVMTSMLERERDAGLRDVRRALDKKLQRLVGRLTRELDFYLERQSVRGGTRVRLMAPVIADALRAEGRRFVTATRRVRSADDGRAAHRARIAAKRVRYLLEPLDAEPEVPPLLETLSALQRSLGDMRDAHRLATRLVREIGERAATEARRRALATLGAARAPERPAFAALRPGVMELARRAHASEGDAFEAYRASWNACAARQFLDAVEVLAGRIVT